jgi:hypothetical protein
MIKVQKKVIKAVAWVEILKFFDAEVVELVDTPS